MQWRSKSCCPANFSTSVHVPKASPRALFAARLKQARELQGIPSQRALGVLMGLDKKLASSRVNRYENETSGIDLDGLGKLAETLGVPMAYLVAEDEATARAIMALARMSAKERRKALVALEAIVGATEDSQP
ncbi:helix-turn-helix transcriptional regulator [Xanthomonas axonopodis pv. begoniae]|nr:helix-turn-helix transcriptional regulator [Xanthomonas axonopodis pv. begoniae]MBO9774081.1 helix-turn-helix transcriptional regulator [Xanthomonas axonopodis pv. begoniae]PPT36086.1 transcriptional regulator [Xanthomonas axonopodis pv. begoniae]